MASVVVVSIDLCLGRVAGPAASTVRQPAHGLASAAVDRRLATMGTHRQVPTAQDFAPHMVVREARNPFVDHLLNKDSP